MKTKIFYGWWIVASLLPAMLVNAGAAFYAFGVFYKPLFAEFGWSRFEVALGVTIYLLTAGLTAPLIGKLTDLYGPKKVILSGAMAASASFILLSRISALWQFYFLYFIIGLGFSACGGVPVNTAIARWFSNKRGLAIGITMAGVSLGAFIITPAGAYVTAAYDWRVTYLFLAGLTFILVIPPLFFFMKDSPQEMGLLPDGVHSEPASAGAANPGHGRAQVDPGAEWTLGKASKTVAFWLICVSFFLIYYGIGAILQHQINYLNDMGIPLTAAAVALGVTGGVGGLGKITFGLICDRFSPKYVTVFCFALQAFGIIPLIFAKSMIMVWIFVMVFGFSMGGQLALQPLLVAYFFGLRAFGTIYGIVLMAGAVGTASGPVLAAMIYDAAGSYQYAFMSCFAAALLASVLVLSSRRPMPA